MPGVVGIFSGKDIEGKMGGLPCGWLINNPDGTPMKEPPHPILAIRQGALRRRPRRDGGGRDASSRRKNAAEAVVVDYDVLPRGGQRGRCREEAERRHHARRGARQPVLQVGDRRQGGGRCGLRQGGARHQARPGQQPADAQRDRAARRPSAATAARTRNTRSTSSNQNPHVERLLMTAFVLGLPEHKVRVIAPDVGGGFGSKIYPVCRGRGADLGRQAAQPQHQVDRRPLASAFLSDAHGRDHVSHAEMAMDSAGQVPGAARAHRRQPGRLPVDLLDRGADHPLRDAAGRPVHHAADLRRGRRLVHQHRAGRCLPRRRPARGHLPAGAPGDALRLGDEPGAGRDPQAQLHHHLPLPDAGGAAVRHGRLPRRCMDKAKALADVAGLRAAPQGRERGQGQAARHGLLAATSRPAASRRRTSPVRSARAPACSNAARSACIRPAA